MDDNERREALGLRRRGQVNYKQELVHDDDPEPPPKRRAAAASSCSGAGRARSTVTAASARKRRAQGSDSDASEDDAESDEDEDESDESDESDALRRKPSRGRGAGKAMQRRSDRPGPAHSKYKEPSDDSDDFHSDGSDDRRAQGRQGSAAMAEAAPIQSVYEKILSQRSAEVGGEDDEGEAGAIEYLAKPRGKCVHASPAASRPPSWLLVAPRPWQRWPPQLAASHSPLARLRLCPVALLSGDDQHLAERRPPSLGRACTADDPHRMFENT